MEDTLSMTYTGLYVNDSVLSDIMRQQWQPKVKEIKFIQCTLDLKKGILGNWNFNISIMLFLNCEFYNQKNFSHLIQSSFIREVGLMVYP